nr:hypothetical protein CFP56_78641 [Quercus suber]
MFETNFSHRSSTALPPAVELETALRILHDFEAVIKLSPDCRACRPIPAPSTTVKAGQTPPPNMQFYEVEDDLPFIPKRMWAGGVRYTADFVPTPNGCDITVHAPGGFVSTNRWRIMRELVHEDGPVALEPVRAQSKDLSHAAAGGYSVEIASEARCPMAFATFVRGFIKNSQNQLQLALIEKIKSLDGGEGQRKRRPTIGRRRSSAVVKITNDIEDKVGTSISQAGLSLQWEQNAMNDRRQRTCSTTPICCCRRCLGLGLYDGMCSSSRRNKSACYDVHLTQTTYPSLQQVVVRVPNLRGDVVNFDRYSMRFSRPRADLVGGRAMLIVEARSALSVALRRRSV